MLVLSRYCYDNHIASSAIGYESFGLCWKSRKGSTQLQRFAILHQFLKTATHVGILNAMNFGRLTIILKVRRNWVSNGRPDVGVVFGGNVGGHSWNQGKSNEREIDPTGSSGAADHRIAAPGL